MEKRVFRGIFVAFIAAVFYCSAAVSLAEAALWESLPVFSGSERIKQEEVLANNTKAQIAVYSAQASLGEIGEFYKEKLNQYGWQLNSETTQQGVTAMLFAKKDKVVNVMLQSVSGRNFITVTQSHLSGSDVAEDADCPDCQQKESAAQGAQDEQPSLFPKEDVPGFDLKTVPRYPGALRINSIERDSGRRASLSYYINDSVEKVLDYYKTNMGIYNWTLDKGINFQGLPAGAPGGEKASMSAQTLVFKNAQGSCIISIFHDTQNNGTVISINYNEK